MDKLSWKRHVSQLIYNVFEESIVTVIGNQRPASRPEYAYLYSRWSRQRTAWSLVAANILTNMQNLFAHHPCSLFPHAPETMVDLCPLTSDSGVCQN